MSEDGLIYQVYNKQNQKKYIGKTKSYYGTTKIGVKGRLSRHFAKAFSKNPVEYNECPLFYNAIRKYGKDAFEVSTLLICDLEQIDMYEILMIKTYDSTNRNFGYNIALGGGGRSVKNIDEKGRHNLSRVKDQENFLLNIRPVIRNDKQVGYVVKRTENGIKYCKKFSNTKNTLEENLNLSKKFLVSLKTNINDDKITVNNKESKLPTNITYVKKDKKIIGYSVLIKYKKKRYEKRFSNQKETLENKLKKALEYKQYVVDTYVKTDETSLKKEQENPQPSP
jgi:hypothetical protein